MTTSERNGSLVGAEQVWDGRRNDADFEPGYGGANPG